MTDWKTVGRRVRQLRGCQTQEEVAEASGVSRSIIGELETKGVSAGITSLIALADYFKVPMDYLLCRTPPSDGPLAGKFIDDPDELAWVNFWSRLDDDERATVLKLLNITSRATG